MRRRAIPHGVEAVEQRIGGETIAQLDLRRLRGEPQGELAGEQVGGLRRLGGRDRAPGAGQAPRTHRAVLDAEPVARAAGARLDEQIGTDAPRQGGERGGVQAGFGRRRLDRRGDPLGRQDLDVFEMVELTGDEFGQTRRHPVELGIARGVLDR